MKKAIFLITLMLFLSLNIHSQTYNMNINLSDGSIVSYSVQEIQKITFDGINNIEDSKQIQDIIKTFKLFQNYPNPFNPTTTIQYEIPKNGMVEIKIFNINGQMVRHLYNGFQNTGVHKIVWDGKNENGHKVVSALYIYHVNFDNSSYAKKMILIK